MGEIGPTSQFFISGRHYLILFGKNEIILQGKLAESLSNERQQFEFLLLFEKK
jgi:hypothetical protein